MLEPPTLMPLFVRLTIIINPPRSNANELESDEAETMDESNIVEGRTRGAAPEKGAYTEAEEENIDEDSEGNVVVKD